MDTDAQDLADPNAEAEPQIVEHLGDPGQVQLPMLRLDLAGAPFQVAKGEKGERLIVIGPLLLQVGIPLNGDGALALARELTGGIEIASSVDAANRLVKR